MDEGREGVIHPGGGASEKERCWGRGREKGRGRKTDRKTQKEKDTRPALLFRGVARILLVGWTSAKMSAGLICGVIICYGVHSVP